ncbi:M57 family metalloprotease [Chondrinema litorale]|uniref:M57 family metalloprotease n=1 Tax=Chondrinema litorale TaxID=2994555 RepID=UPI002542C470|nr:M57 family metalloprotease [Chondrinema litorale]UZR92414.1 M57 family metalloprotease [Chondrinema litorale]
MKHLNLLLTGLLCLLFTFSCQQDEIVIAPEDAIPSEILLKLNEIGFNTIDFQVKTFEEGYLVENDIYLTESQINKMSVGRGIPAVEQYSTDNLVSTSGSRVITIYAPEEGTSTRGKKTSGYSPAMIAGLDLAIARYNAENLEISFQRVTSSSSADIVMTRLSRRDERRGVLGSAGFPTASGDPYDEIKMSGVLESSYGLDTEGIATIIAHEMGHCVGFRHTDYFDRSISCGGSTSNEGDGGVGANHIPGTPTGATYSAQSWMLSCTDGSDRPFNNDDKTALDYLY